MRSAPRPHDRGPAGGRPKSSSPSARSPGPREYLSRPDRRAFLHRQRGDRPGRRLPGHGVPPDSIATPAQKLGGEKHETVEEQQDRRRQRGREQHAQRLLCDQSHDTDRNRARDEQPGEAGITVVVDASVADRSDESSDDAHPIAPVEQDQGQCGCDVQRDDEGEKWRVSRTLRLRDQFRPVSTEPGGDEDRMPEARHRKQFGDALQKPENRRLRVGQVSHEKRSLSVDKFLSPGTPQ